MGRFDNRRSSKMRRKRAQAAKKKRELGHAEQVRVERHGSTAKTSKKK